MEELAPAGAGGLCESVFLENSVLLYFVGAVSSEIFSPYVAEGSLSGLFLSYIVSRRFVSKGSGMSAGFGTSCGGAFSSFLL